MSRKVSENPRPVSGNAVNENRLKTGYLKSSDIDGQKRWAANKGVFFTADETFEALPAGLYRPGSNQQIGVYLRQMVFETDELINFPDSPCQKVLEEIKTFWGLANKFREFGFLHKRGVLMTGAPGTGKTSTINLLISTVINDHNGIAVYLDDPNEAIEALQMVRRIEPKRPIIAVLEDLDALIDDYDENGYLSLLDGEAQVSNIVFLGTTNYFEKLDKRFTDRPSRFDLVMEIPPPNAEGRRLYLTHKIPSLNEEEVTEWVLTTKGYSLAHLRETIILRMCYEYSLDAAIKRINGMREQANSLGSDTLDTGQTKQSVGFIPRRSSDDYSDTD